MIVIFFLNRFAFILKNILVDSPSSPICLRRNAPEHSRKRFELLVTKYLPALSHKVNMKMTRTFLRQYDITVLVNFQLSLVIL